MNALKKPYYALGNGHLLVCVYVMKHIWSALSYWRRWIFVRNAIESYYKNCPSLTFFYKTHPQIYHLKILDNRYSVITGLHIFVVWLIEYIRVQRPHDDTINKESVKWWWVLITWIIIQYNYCNKCLEN